jgi:hypothetical protein
MFNKLKIEGNNFHITKRSTFNLSRSVSEKNVLKCLEFSLSMTFNNEGEHRVHRSGGSLRRDQKEIFINTFQGKMSEIGLFELLSSHGLKCSDPDFDTWKKGTWDSFDMNVEGKILNIKSTKYYGNLLLLETKDWNEKGHYIPNINTDNYEYDFIFLIRLKPDTNRIIGSHLNKYRGNDIRETFPSIMSEKWYYDLPGYVTSDDLIDIISQKLVLPKRGMLNGKISMDAENYYVQSGDLRRFDEKIFYNS